MMSGSDQQQGPPPNIEPEMAAYQRDHTAPRHAHAKPSVAGDAPRLGMSAEHQMPAREMNEVVGDAAIAPGEMPRRGMKP